MEMLFCKFYAGFLVSRLAEIRLSYVQDVWGRNWLTSGWSYQNVLVFRPFIQFHLVCFLYLGYTYNRIYEVNNFFFSLCMCGTFNHESFKNKNKLYYSSERWKFLFSSSVLKFTFLLLCRSLILSNLSECDNKTFTYREGKKTSSSQNFNETLQKVQLTWPKFSFNRLQLIHPIQKTLACPVSGNTVFCFWDGCCTNH